MKNDATIFVVQENVGLNNPLVKRLKTEVDSQVLVFSNLREIEKALDYSTPTLLVIDIDFSDLNVRNRVLNLISFSVPSIVISNDNNKQFAVSLLKKGAVDFIQKTKFKFLENLTKSVKEVTAIIELRLNLKKQKLKQLKNLRNALVIFSGTFLLTVAVVSFVKWFI